MFDLRKIFYLRKFFAVPKNFLNSKIHCIYTSLFFRYPLELHIVHTNAAHDNDTTAALDPEECFKNGAYCGLAVVGILFHIGSENNTVMDVSHISLKIFIL